MLIPRVLGFLARRRSLPLVVLSILAAGALAHAYPGAARRLTATDGSVSYTASVEQAAVPSAPQNLTGGANGNTVTLNWQVPSSGAVTSYTVEAALTPGGPLIASVPVLNTTLVVPNVPNGNYYVRVRAVNSDGAGPASNEILITVPGGGGGGCTSAPNAPQGLTGSVNGSLVTLNWSAGGGCAATGFILFAGSGAGLSNLAQINLGATTLSASAPPGTFYIRVVAVNAYGTSPASNEVVLTVQNTCSIPGAPVLLAPGVSGTTVTLSWLAATGTVTGYVVEAGSFSGGANLLNTMAGATGYTWFNAPAGTSYIRVRAMSACGVGPASNQVTVTVSTPAPPPPSCGPRSAPCGTATAVCRDGTLSCSQNRSGTCSSHGGVACWICPGLLCG